MPSSIMTAYLETMGDNWKAMAEKDRLAKECGQLVGRYITEPIVDDCSFYEIVEEHEATVRIRLIRGIEDNWPSPYWGRENTMMKEYAQQNLKRRDCYA